jgi:surface protein|tara:strand:+ start:5889 stop:6677 length:789 start_codon:yes stop_codon:yes gene_type:complete
MDNDGFQDDIAQWKTDQVTDMQNLFKDKTMFNADISRWNVSNVINMSGMFDGAKAFNQDISGWDVREVSHMDNMFRGALVFDQDLDRWDPRNVTHSNNMFDGAASFNSKLPIFSNIMFHLSWLKGTTKKLLKDRAMEQFSDIGTMVTSTCPRCSTVYDEIDNIGRWACSFHPGSYDTTDGFSCCGCHLRSAKTTRWVRLGFVPEHVVQTHFGCTPCDHGLNLKSIVLNDMLDVANYLDPSSLHPGSKKDNNGTVTIQRFKPN